MRGRKTPAHERNENAVNGSITEMQERGMHNAPRKERERRGEEKMQQHVTIKNENGPEKRGKMRSRGGSCTGEGAGAWGRLTVRREVQAPDRNAEVRNGLQAPDLLHYPPTPTCSVLSEI